MSILNTLNLQKIRRRISQIFCVHQDFCHPHQNRDLDQNLLALANYFFFFFFLPWFRLCSPLKHTAWLFNLFKSTACRYIITWANCIYFKLGCVPIWSTKDIVIETMPECFKDTYPDKRVIIDRTELFCQMELF